MAMFGLGLIGAAAGAYGYKYYKERPTTVSESEVFSRSQFPSSELLNVSARSAHSWCAPDAQAEIVVAEKGIGSFEPVTVMDAFKKAKDSNKDSRALVSSDFKRVWTWEQYYNDVLRVARGLVKLGVSDYGSVCIIGFNSPEWFMGNLGAIACGAKAAGIYPTNGPESASYIAHHAEAEVILCENAHQAEKFLQKLEELPHLKAIVVWSGDLPKTPDTLACLGWEQFLELGGDEQSPMHEIVEERLARQRPGHCCTLIYTSGTTGAPKAVMISHDNLTWTAHCLLEYFPGMRPGPHEFLSYLPLSHVAAQMLDIHAPIMFGYAGIKACLTFARPDALKGSLGDTLKQVRPTGFFGVPRVWEKIQEKIMAAGASTTGMKKNVAVWAKSVGAQNWIASQLPEEGSRTKQSPPMTYGLANSLVFKAVKQRLGLDRCVFFISGAAPITRDTLQFFGSLDIHILEVYGMSECTGPSTIGVPSATRVGTVGPAIPGVEIKLDHEAGRDKPGHGEICYRGRNIMMGYMKNQAKTTESIDKEGWLHSGDVGHFDEFGLLSITGRIKELIITAGGENIAPVPIEEAIKAELPGISNVMMVGDKRKYNVCLVTLNSEQDPETARFTNKLTGRSLDVNGSEATTTQEAKACPKWDEYLKRGLGECNKRAVSNAQKIQKYYILEEDFSDQSGDLTPTLKLKRSVVSQKYNEQIEGLYAQ
mmetsp:Transcript_3967/g.5174  ORF Transcript_3967/g.5174 Transcript_3967/m.5174 type:complete len:707 (-) Transcript_3967:26-2146(-)|eukprot:CAMPEP_0201488052 /NCGR_PEP_ID=MMETSP0151_2-20130828/16585_1 /ASSEMBLY_ACC=CAM_ASM_000257 /TAXON_ID=200890 /ORGANISM="Paramoeba atlantica, Strain 621/1 / CCAP 1560/9" /LENGTH=706 /DNA_ID=CAMNT_0047873265 /DNA_START=44 /DNA_END=2164 /DNA_ORIENTATION=+